MHWRPWHERARPLAISSGPDTARPEAPGADATRRRTGAMVAALVALLAALLALIFNL